MARPTRDGPGIQRPRAFVARSGSFPAIEAMEGPLFERVRAWFQRVLAWFSGEASRRGPRRLSPSAEGGRRRTSGEVEGFRRKLEEARRTPGPYRKR